MIEAFFSENWPTIIITLICGLVFFIASLHIFSGYKEKSLENERGKKAKETVIDILESSLINKQSILPVRIKHLISASEREQSTELKDPPKRLLEDLELRFEKSKHLDTEQQTRYIDQIEEMISKIESESKMSSVPLSYEEIVTSLKENIETEKKDDALNDLDQLFTKISSFHRHQELPFIVRLIKEKPIKFIAIIISYFAFLVSLIIFLIYY
jgi:hypothetical protein